MAKKTSNRLSRTARTAAAGVVAACLWLAAAAASAQAGAKPNVDDNAAMASKAASVFGPQAGQSFDAHAVSRGVGAMRTDTITVTLAPGKGAEVKATLAAGQGFVFQWTASADVAVDMHGEVPDAKDEYTSYWIEGAQREGAGAFTAKFTGLHGWYWRNKGKSPVTVQVSVTGFQTKLARPGH